MKLLDLTLDGAAENVALDNALVETADAQLATDSASDGREFEILRLWEPARPVVVIGRSSRVAQEVDVEACHAAGATIVRRTSGGAAIVSGPGCMMYAVVLSYRRRPELRGIDVAHAFVLDRIVAALSQHAPGVTRRGTSDLAIVEADSVDTAGMERKFSGNAMRCRRDFLLYHGTLLYDFRLDLAAKLLRTPPRQPEYRHGRSHTDFITNLPLTRETLRTAVVSAFSANEAATNEQASEWPREETAKLAQEKYGTVDWTNLL
jgi:lipoate-protein ligase A